MDTKPYISTALIISAVLGLAQFKAYTTKAYNAHCQEIRTRPLITQGAKTIEPKTSLEKIFYPNCRPQIDVPENIDTQEPYREKYRYIEPLKPSNAIINNNEPLLSKAKTAKCIKSKCTIE